MNYSTKKSAHSFHVPVMGTGFSIDTPLKVARYGISSAISLVDDILMEQMRKYHCQQLGLSFVEIPESGKDARANRISTYLDFVDELVRDQVRALQASPFEDGSEISRYFELDLPKLTQEQKKHINPYQLGTGLGFRSASGWVPGLV